LAPDANLADLPSLWDALEAEIERADRMTLTVIENASR
jgi:hypothetical protein